MKKNELIKKLQKIEGNPDVVIDHDEDGWWNLEEVGKVGSKSHPLINLVSSAEM